MATKRKASQGATSLIPRKRQAKSGLNDSDPIYEEPHSEAEYTSSEVGSEDSDGLKGTPATPYSSTSAKYPSELKTHRCPFEGCTKAFNRPARLQEHLRSHNNERIFKCDHDDCDKTFLRASHLAHHIKSAHTGVRDYVCDRPECGKSFVTGSRLRRHLAAHDGRDKYRCTEYPPCDETFRKHTTLQKHILAVHLKKKPYTCPHMVPTTGEKCTMGFDTAGHLRSHETRVHTEKRFSCTECASLVGGETFGTTSSFLPVTFPTYALLQAHIKAAHPPQCLHCAMICATSRELRRHLEVAHGDVVSSSVDQKQHFFPCTVPGCDRSFTKKGNLTVHIRTVHEGEKRFVCGETDLSTSKKVEGWTNAQGCGKRYGSKLALEEHIRTAHLGFPNAKAEKRQRLGLAGRKKNSRSASGSVSGSGQLESGSVSALAALTGEGYLEESGRHIPCLMDSCPHRFHRDYDLWVHMSGKHGCSEDEIQNLFMRRALLADAGGGAAGPHDNLFGIYGLEFDDEGPPSSSSSSPYEMNISSGNHHAVVDDDAVLHPGLEQQQLVVAAPDLQDTVMYTDYVDEEEEHHTTSMIHNENQMALIDPNLAYNMMVDG